MNLLRIFADWFGYDVLRQSKDVFIERHLRNLFSHHSIDCVLDIGANHGQYADALRKCGYQGEIHSFEPHSVAYQELTELSAEDDNWYTYHYALGSEAGELAINITAYDDFTSFLTPSQYSTNTFAHKSKIERQETVQIRRLDEVFPDGLTGRKIHLKMDTQGFDLEVFQGTGDILDSVKTLQSEISIRQIYEGMPDYITALKTYRDARFNISGMFPVTRDKQDLSVIEFDCVMVRA